MGVVHSNGEHNQESLHSSSFVSPSHSVSLTSGCNTWVYEHTVLYIIVWGGGTSAVYISQHVTENRQTALDSTLWVKRQIRRKEERLTEKEWTGRTRRSRWSICLVAPHSSSITVDTVASSDITGRLFYTGFKLQTWVCSVRRWKENLLAPLGEEILQFSTENFF